MNSNEKWLPIKNYENYLVSNKGNVYSNRTKKILKPLINKSGYAQVGLRSKKFYVHRLVAITFISKNNDRCQVNHIDGNKQNNRIENLEWSTSLLNTNHAINLGLIDKKGEKCNFSKLKTNEVIKIKKLIKKGMVYRSIAKKFNVSPALITLIKQCKRWKHLKVKQ